MTTEQMDEKDRQYNYVGVTAQSLVDGQSTADRRKAAADAGPVILYGDPSKEEIAEARGHAGSRGVMVLPEELRDSTIGNVSRIRSVSIVPEGEGLGWIERAEHPGFEDDGLESHEWAGEEQDRIMREDGIVDITRHSEDTLSKVHAALFKCGITGVHQRTDLISEMQNAGILFRERAPEYEMQPESTNTIKSENVEATLAEEPIEQRLRRAWLNGFRDGVDRASFAATESTGKWDY
jgi:hypothetical protein